MLAHTNNIRAEAKYRFKINMSSFFEKCGCVLFLLPFLELQGLTYSFDFDWSYIRLICGIAFLFTAFPSVRLLNKSCFFYGLFYLSILFSTFMNQRDIIPAITLAWQMISFILVINYYAKTNRLYTLFFVMKRLVGSLILVTFFIQLIDQNIFGVSEAGNSINFLVSDNFLGYYYISFILIVYLSDIKKKKCYRFFDICFWVAICTASLICAWAGTCLVVFIFFVVLLIIRNWKILRLFTPLIALITNAGISILVIFYQIQKYFDWLIVDILHKNLTLSFRTYIWASAIANILKKPIIGYGTVRGGRLDINRFSWGIGLSNTAFSHNVYLEILMQGGIVAMMFFVLIYFFAHRQLMKIKENTEIKSMICISIFFILLMQFSEFAIYLPIANLPLILCFFYKDLLQEIAEISTF